MVFLDSRNPGQRRRRHHISLRGGPGGQTTWHLGRPRNCCLLCRSQDEGDDQHTPRRLKPRLHPVPAFSPALLLFSVAEGEILPVMALSARAACAPLLPGGLWLLTAGMVASARRRNHLEIIGLCIERNAGKAGAARRGRCSERLSATVSIRVLIRVAGRATVRVS